MSYPLIILGAGASMDYLKADDHIEHRDGNFSKYRSPLMNQIFDDARFYEILSRHPEIDSFVSDAMNAMSRPNANFEDYLTNLRDNIAPDNEKVYSQLLSLIFYLADLFSEISEKFYYRRNNYKNILHKIDNYFNGQACFVNFNYDLLLERSLNEHTSGTFNYSSLENYISSNIKIIKIHGACNWRYNPQTVQTKQINAKQFFSTFSKKLILETNNDQIYPYANSISSVNFNPEYNESLKCWTVKLPALALPLKNKPKNYVCNDSHIAILKVCIKKADRILIIGWRDVDKYMLNLLNTELGDRKINTSIVTKNTTPETTFKYFEVNAPQLIIKSENICQKGFSEFIKTDNYDNFFTNG